MTYLEKGDFANAEKSLLEVAHLGQREPRSVLQPRRSEVREGRNRRSGEVLPARRDMDANWGKPLFKLGLARLQKADTAGAIEIMNKVIAVDPNSAEAAQAKALIEQLKKG